MAHFFIVTPASGSGLTLPQVYDGGPGFSVGVAVGRRRNIASRKVGAICTQSPRIPVGYRVRESREFNAGEEMVTLEKDSRLS